MIISTIPTLVVMWVDQLIVKSRAVQRTARPVPSAA
jgi:hypothetical protein